MVYRPVPSIVFTALLPGPLFSVLYFPSPLVILLLKSILQACVLVSAESNEIRAGKRLTSLNRGSATAAATDIVCMTYVTAPLSPSR